MRVIAHRGLIDGPDKHIENRTDQIEFALSKGYDVEIDVRSWLLKSNLFLLSHDGNQYDNDHLVNEYWFRDLLKKYPKTQLWLHCKTIESLYEVYNRFSTTVGINIFYHNEDDVTLTNTGYFWTYPGETLTSQSVCVLPEREMTPSMFKENYNEKVLNQKLIEQEKQWPGNGHLFSVVLPYAICTDFARLMKKAIT